jgi:hypothetical protein
MCCAADRHRSRRALAAAARRTAAVLALAAVAAGCSPAGSGPANHRPGLSRPGLRRFAGAVFVGGGGQLIAVGGLSGRNGGRPQVSVPPIPPGNSTRPIVMPLDVYEQVATQEQDAISESQTLLIQQCMTSRGFSYPAPASSNNGFVALQQVEDDPYGLTSMTRAQTYGYAQPKGSGQQGPQIIGFVGGGLFAGALKNHGPAYTQALFGFTPGLGGGGGRAGGLGCFQQSIREVYGSLDGNPDPDPVPSIAAQAAQWAQTDRRVVAVERAWSRCMASHGYSFGTPLQAQQHNWPSKPTTGEVATAVADVSCKARTNLPNTWLTVEAAYQQALVAQNLAALSELQKNFTGLLQRAEALLSGQPVPGGQGLPGGQPVSGSGLVPAQPAP